MTLRRKLAARILRKLNDMALNYVEKHRDKLEPAKVMAALLTMARVEEAAQVLDGTLPPDNRVDDTRERAAEMRERIERGGCN